MTNHPGRKRPAWIAAAEALAEQRIASARRPGGVHVLTPEQMAQVIRDTTVWAYGEGLRAATTPAAQAAIGDTT